MFNIDVIIYLIFFYLTVLFLSVDVMKLMNKYVEDMPDVLQAVMFVVIFLSVHAILAKIIFIFMKTFS